MSALLRTALSAAMVSSAAASCAYGTTLAPRAEGEVPIATFGYSGALGPANWFSLNSTTNGACAQGTHQSPIDIVPDSLAQVSGAELSIDLPDFPQGATFENLGSTIEVVGQNGSLILPNGSDKVFNFKQFHFHTPSEHLENGTSAAMEVHFVFQADDSEIAVLGAYIDITDTGATTSANCTSPDPASAASNVIETVFASVGDISNPGTATTTAALAMSNIVSFLQGTTFRTYTGSLTTPPCSEGVNWHVATDMLSISLSSYKAAHEVIGFNSRFAQCAPGEENVLTAAFNTMSASAAAAAA